MGMIKKKTKIRLVVASKYAKNITGDRYRMGFRYIYPLPCSLNQDNTYHL